MIPLTQRCPVCRARLLKPRLPGKVRCPRCGAEFRPSVPLVYFQILLVLFVAVCSLLAFDWSSRYFWPVFVFAALLIFFLGFLPRIVRMEIDPNKIPVAEGAGPEELKLPYDDWEEPEQGVRPGIFLIVSGTLLALIVILVFVKVLA